MREQLPGLKDQYSEIKNKLELAKKAAPNIEDLESDDIRGIEFPKDAQIEVQTLLDFRLVMELLGFPEDNILDTLAHENAHANKAEMLGVKHVGYRVSLMRTKGGFAAQPTVIIDTPDEWPEERRKEVMKQIISAPEEYGNELSPDDLKDLDKA